MDDKVRKEKKSETAVKDTLLSKLYAYKTHLNAYDSHISESATYWSKTYRGLKFPTIIDNECRVGIEIEVENVRSFKEDDLFCWQLHDDPSLRNNGREFVTYPISGQTIPLALQMLFDYVLPQDREFTKRTSDHVHINVRNMTPSQIASFVCLFIVFEKLLYKFVGNDRDKNIFCVPLQQTMITDSLLSGIHTGFKSVRWYKYSGLNLIPIGNQGSIEFRQLYGTDNISIICSWINLLLRLRQYSIMYPMDTILAEIKNLNTNSQYDIFAQKVFQEQVMLLDLNNVLSDMEIGVIAVKQCTLVNRFHQGMLDNVITTSDLLTPIMTNVIEKKVQLKPTIQKVTFLTENDTFRYEEIPEPPVQINDQHPWNVDNIDISSQMNYSQAVQAQSAQVGYSTIDQSFFNTLMQLRHPQGGS